MTAPAPTFAPERKTIPALDGLRAVAVLGVLIFHIYPNALLGGFMGVDVFFVLSGFLITSIIREDLKTGVFTFREFYLRRIQRLLPNAITTVFLTVLLFLLFLPFGPENNAGRHGIWTLLNLSNIFTWSAHGDYWGSHAHNSPFTHFWSLGIEEQFYLLFPLLFFSLYKISQKISTRAFPNSLPNGNFAPPSQTQSSGRLIIPELILLALVAASFLASLKTTFQTPSNAFYLPHLRFWELLAGAWLALKQDVFSEHRRSTGNASRWDAASGGAGLLLVLFSFVVFSENQPFPGWVALFPVIGALLVINSITTGNSPVSRFLALPPVVQIGKYS
jgi:peptidoglycan/LPS O-acetylase OafA/YrhL